MIEAGGWRRIEGGAWRLEVGGWRLTVGGWKRLESGGGGADLYKWQTSQAQDVEG
jgi:hypothetical protein